MEIPKYCPYCGSRNLEELMPTELLVDNLPWLIKHYECQSCLEVFDKIMQSDDEFFNDASQNN
jgi:DNA-directed RNA polymerase subunit RPC12/RpoP